MINHNFSKVLPVSILLFLGLAGCDNQESMEGRALKSQDIPNFAGIQNTELKKQTFFDYLLPLITLANKEVKEERERLREIAKLPNEISNINQKWVLSLCTTYKAQCEKDEHIKASVVRLLDRLGMVPPSMALAQAANESAWGTSRFAVDGHNYFGQWCYTEGCGIVPANRNRHAKHEVRVFDHPLDSVRSYVHNINTSSSYKELRELRLQARKQKQPILGRNLARGLIRYSERREEYVKEIQHMIKLNDLTSLDLNSLPKQVQVQ